MKKKIICIAACLLLALSGAGCSAQDAKTSLDENMPWDVYEKCTYDVTKYYLDGNNSTEIANGTYTTEVKKDGDLSTAENHFELTYNNDEHTRVLNEFNRYALNAGLTDSYDASVTFYHSTLVPTEASKTFNIAQRPLTDDKMPERKQLHSDEENAQDGEELFSYTFPSTVTSVNYADPRGYSYYCDYTTNKATLTTDMPSMNGSVRTYKRVKKDITPASNTRFDNEQLNYVVRAISNIKTKGSATFYLSNFFDSYLSGEYVRYTMAVNCAEKMESLVLALSSDEFRLTDSLDELEKTSGGYKVNCVKASVGLTGTNNTGTSITMYITEPDVTVTQRSNNVKTKKLIAQMEYEEYGIGTAKLAYRTVYTLSGYTTESEK